MSTGATLNRHRSKQDYSTPKDFISAVIKRFGVIDFDLAADKRNTKASQFYSVKDNSLVQDWGQLSGILWLNPPFNSIEPWAKKCAYHSQAHKSRILFLVPASVGSNWFADYVHNKALVLACNPRLSFDSLHPYPKDIILACYNFSRIGFECWKWK